MAGVGAEPQFHAGRSADNYVSLRDYINERINAAEQLNTTRFEAVESMFTAQNRATTMALDKATAAIDYRLVAMNEFRDSLRDQTRLYVTKSEFDGLRALTSAEIKSIQKTVYMITGGLVLLQAIISLFGNRFFP